MTEDETRQRILEAAASVFSQRGYSGASTRAIAALAQVNEVTLFRHFGTKMNLFQVMVERNSALPVLELALRQQMSGDYHKDLLLLVTHILTLMCNRRQGMLMSLADAEQLPEMRTLIASIPDQQRRMLSGFLQRHIEQGHVRPVDPDLAAQALMGMLLAYSISLNTLPEGMAGQPLDRVAAAFVDLFVDGTRA